MFDSDRKEDELLAIRCQLGEPDAFDALIARWHEPLWRYLRRLTGDEDAAADAVQDAWLRILRGMPRLRECARVRAWIFGIARRVVMDRLRERYAEPRLVSTEDVDLPTDEQSNDLQAELLLLQEELSRLPLPEREVLVLFYLEELTLNEIADVMDIPAGTVKSRLFRARKALREQLILKGVNR
jgi:RNA polymerase sigma factor (sigma-70 family)